jgi:hypothetical protein
MKKILVFTILLLVTTMAFSQTQTLRDKANSRLEAAGTRSQQYDAIIAEMEGRLHDNQNGREYNRIAGRLNTIEINMIFLRNSFNDAQTPQERERILGLYKDRKTEYDNTRNELQQFIGTLRQN